MVRMKNEPDDNPLRDRIFELLRKSPTTAAEDLKALLQCVSQIRNRAIVLQAASECRLKLCNFQTNVDQELYYDIQQGRQEIGYISKTYDNPAANQKQEETRYGRHRQKG